MTSRKRLHTIVVGLVAATALGAGGYALAATATVQLTATGPQPPVATVSWGDTVVFQNADDAPLTIQSGHTDFNSPAIPPGGTYQKVFDGKVGNYPYRATKPKEKGGTSSIHGSVVVKMTATLTLSATPTTAVYGRAVALQGTTTLLDHPITVQQKTTSAAKTGWTDVTQVSPGSDGSFSFAATPLEKTAYRATQAAGQLASASVSVRVAPVVTMRVSSRTAVAGTPITVTARVQPAASSIGVLLQASSGHGWKQVGKAKLREGGRAKLIYRVPDGKVSLRAAVQPPVVRPGFESARSKPVLIVGANAPATLRFQVYTQKKKGKHAALPSDRFSTRSLHVKPGKVTLSMKNLGRGRHGLAVTGPGVRLKGPVVSHGGTSSVTAMLKRGTYTFYSYVGADKTHGESGKLIVRS